MHSSTYAAFECFLKQCGTALRRIASHTRGEYTVEDVQGAAWVLAEELKASKSVAIAFEDPTYQQMLIRFLYQQLVRYTETQVRHAVRLDHWHHGDDPGHDQHPLMRKLSADSGSDPLVAILARENEDLALQIDPLPHESRAAAYLHLMRRFDNRMREVAKHLLISLSYCYYRYNEAKSFARCQTPLSSEGMWVPDEFLPRGWRSFRATRPWKQMELDLGDVANLWVESASGEH
ncbi:hypothetical protein KDH83_09285 [Achromobacter sp. Marseille-Q0513]|uniref:hypothetical protein n=1 Tax=Achromobacter sp. Marseille-Q0513 TaxID=2829161 RepID=UPI001B947225|nr:hypothetical protein [Achromobacter sp. Marseille-Q0513]MBR8653497.1 hypothetical protein [Achromobacter sp. Marseille-Q0513]